MMPSRNKREKYAQHQYKEEKYPVWHPHTTQNINALESVQSRAARQQVVSVEQTV